MTYKRHRFWIAAPPAPPNPFFALKCSTSDPLPPAQSKLGGRVPGVIAYSTGLAELAQSSRCRTTLRHPCPARRAPFHMLQPMVRGTRRPQTGLNPDVPAMFARERDSLGLERVSRNDLVGLKPIETNCAAAPPEKGRFIIEDNDCRRSAECGKDGGHQ
ncbi:MAG: hypothetical protein A4E57_02224 [Syntrophorhabdaceae bacterium PtaU1.Bin034]|nr:MAG: hypothetical protein A4E57_02224 [Syntrophorhabdaceae bacterium PtaU1.Bin034]